MDMISDKIYAYASELKISDVGFCKARAYTELAPHLDGKDTPFCKYSEKRIDPFLTMPDAKSFIICMFNYYCGSGGNIAKYAHGDDYHTVVTNKLNAMCDMIKRDIPDFKGYVFCDNSPMCDKYLAYLCGLGFFGKNSLLISQKYGSYTVIGGILTNIEIDRYGEPLPQSCKSCGKCAEVCPSGAISDGVDAKSCVSYLLQKKGAFNDIERKAVKKSGMVWGCDKCQDVCPHNQNPIITDIDEFKNNICSDLNAENMENFSEKYKNKAFAWRGKAVMERNIKTE